jgi:hypothetical protein
VRHVGGSPVHFRTVPAARNRGSAARKFTLTVEMGSAYARAVIFAANTGTPHLKNCANSSGTVTGWPGRTL